MPHSVAIAEPGSPLPAVPNPAALGNLAARRSSAAPTLVEPGPAAGELQLMLRLATRVPDHGRLAPWRFVVLQNPAKMQFVIRLEVLAERMENAGRAAAALAKLRNPPTTIAVISKVVAGKIPAWEQELSAGAVCMNLLQAAHAMGFGANWITDWYAYDEAAMALLGLAPGERVAGYVHIGTQSEVPKERPRADLGALVEAWRPDVVA